MFSPLVRLNTKPSAIALLYIANLTWPAVIKELVEINRNDDRFELDVKVLVNR